MSSKLNEAEFSSAIGPNSPGMWSEFSKAISPNSLLVRVLQNPMEVVASHRYVTNNIPYVGLMIMYL